MVHYYKFSFLKKGINKNDAITVSVEHPGHDPKIIWEIGRESGMTGKWLKGQVEVTPIDAAENPYRVRKQRQNDELLTVTLYYFRLLLQHIEVRLMITLWL